MLYVPGNENGMEYKLGLTISDKSRFAPAIAEFLPGVAHARVLGFGEARTGIEPNCASMKYGMRGGRREVSHIARNIDNFSYSYSRAATHIVHGPAVPHLHRGRGGIVCGVQYIFASRPYP